MRRFAKISVWSIVLIGFCALVNSRVSGQVACMGGCHMVNAVAVGNVNNGQWRWDNVFQQAQGYIGNSLGPSQGTHTSAPGVMNKYWKCNNGGPVCPWGPGGNAQGSGGLAMGCIGGVNIQQYICVVP